MDKFLSTEAFNSSGLMKFGEVDFCILPILGLQRPQEGGSELVPLIPQGGALLVPLITLRSGVEVPLIMVPLIPLEEGIEDPLIKL